MAIRCGFGLALALSLSHPCCILTAHSNISFVFFFFCLGYACLLSRAIADLALPPAQARAAALAAIARNKRAGNDATAARLIRTQLLQVEDDALREACCCADEVDGGMDGALPMQVRALQPHRLLRRTGLQCMRRTN